MTSENLLKCKFAVRNVEYLGHLLPESGVLVNQQKSVLLKFGLDHKAKETYNFY